MFRAVIGQAQCVETECAAGNVIRQCRARLAGAAPGAGIVFSSSGFDLPQLLDITAQSFPDMPLIGCTTAGQFSTALGLSLDSICLVLFVSDTVRFGVGLGRNALADPEGAASEAAAMARAAWPDEPASLAFAFPEAMGLTPGRLVSALSAAFGCPVFGGFSAGEGRDDVRQFFGREVVRGAVPVLCMFGPVRACFAVSNSWRPVGRRVRVDAVDGARVLRIDGKTAVDFYRDTLGPHGLPATEMPLAVFADDGRFAIRGPMDYDEEGGGIVFSDVVPEGAEVRITEATREGVIRDVARSLEELVRIMPADFIPDAALAFSCSTRRYILGQRSREEFELMRGHFPPGLPIAGFHAYGEISPLAPGEPARFHNCTLVTVLFGDGKGDGASFPVPPVEAPAPECAADAMAMKDREIRFLKKQLARSEQLIVRLEHLRDIGAGLQSRMNTELRDANLIIKEKNRLLREALALAEEVQLRLLPRDNPAVPGFDIAGKSISCDETGGDYYDYLAVPGAWPGSVAIVVGDVSGHGVASALLMTTARALLRMRASMGGGPACHVEDLNRLLTQDTAETGRFVTLFYLSMEPSPDGSRPGRMRWVRAGHDPALVYDPKTGGFLELSEGGVPLGIIGDVAYEEFVFEGMAGGQVVALGTDGIWEARNRNGEMFGKKRLRRIIKENTDLAARKIVSAVFEELEAFRRGLPAEDDVTLVVVKVL
ncbi:SpoIIE family protein phosphatase [Desulfolutivibrio sp.]|uniref:SpoIIE family protein phosphatase n=1 Tax=Desulfolutivibrio sp. TaxID=2773296 RepID=UPI002F96C95A